MAVTNLDSGQLISGPDCLISGLDCLVSDFDCLISGLDCLTGVQSRDDRGRVHGSDEPGREPARLARRPVPPTETLNRLRALRARGKEAQVQVLGLGFRVRYPLQGYLAHKKPPPPPRITIGA